MYLTFFCLFGLAIGSFLNVVIYRLPLMERAEERAIIWDWLKSHQIKVPKTRMLPGKTEPLTLSSPRSACPNCRHTLTIFENIPVLSYLFLRGRCRGCSQSISMRYPVIELLTAALFLLIFLEFGLSWQSASAGFFAALLIALAAIDFDQQILPDPLTSLLLWTGLTANAFNLFIPPQDAILGAAAGYGCFWLLYQGHHRLTGREGLGYGDFKLFAGLGAWLGWQQLPIIALIAACLGLLIFFMLKVKNRNIERMAFGPFLASGGVICLLYGQDINTVLSLLVRSAGL